MTRREVKKKVDDLISKMTVDEKIDQMVLVGCNATEEIANRIKNGEDLYISTTYNAEKININEVYTIQENQLNKEIPIPVLFAGEGLHGLMHPNATIFPTEGCLAATFSCDLAQKFGEVVGEEARSLGIRQVYGPNLDIVRDYRWGRAEESFGEDTLLTSKMGVSVVKGLQRKGVASTLKHYLAYGLCENGLNLSDAHVGERELREFFLPPFVECIKAGAMSIMPSYNSIDGIPVHVSNLWMNTVLRKENKFDGVVVTDFGATKLLSDGHNITNDSARIGESVVKNGVDIEACGVYAYGDGFRKAVKDGRIDIKYVNNCVRRILTLKYKLGLFDEPYKYIEEGKLHSKKAVSLAKEIAEKGIVMLKNDGLLPKAKLGKVAIVGPNSNINQFGDYTTYTKFDEKSKVYLTSIYNVFKNKLGEENVFFERGCGFGLPIDEDIEKAVEVCEKADTVILACGDNSIAQSGGCPVGATTETDVTSGEGYDMNYLELTPSQVELIRRVGENCKNIILLLYGGRPHAITNELKYCNAVFQMFGAGEKGNEAIFDIITGKINPSGKLPVSFPRSTGNMPCNYNYYTLCRGYYKKSGSYGNSGRDYVFDSPNSLFPFGYGLSYTKYDYKNLQAKLVKDTVIINVEVENVGNYNGEEAVLVYASPEFCPVCSPVKKLVGFTRVSLKKHESKKVEIKIPITEFSYIDVNMKKVINCVRYKLTVGEKEVYIDVEK